MSTNTPVQELPDDSLPPTGDLLRFLRERCKDESATWEAFLRKTSTSLHDEVQAYFDALGLERTNAQLRERLARSGREELNDTHELHEVQARLREKELEVEQLKQQVLSLLEIRSPLADRIDFTILRRRQQPDSLHVTDMIAAFRESWHKAATEALTPMSGRPVPARERRLMELGQHPDQLAVADAARAVLRAPAPTDDTAALALLLQTAEQRAADLERDYQALSDSQAQTEAALREAFSENALEQQRIVNGQAQLVQACKVTEAELRRQVVAERLQASKLLRLLGEERCAHAKTVECGSDTLRRLESQNKAAVKVLQETMEDERRRSEEIAAEREAREGRMRRAALSTSQQTIELREQLAQKEAESEQIREKMEKEIRTLRLQLESAKLTRIELETQLRNSREEANEMRAELQKIQDEREAKRLRREARPQLSSMEAFRPR